MSLTGIDVSSYQGTINWWAVKQNGIDFAILKVIRKDLNPDKKFEENWRKCDAYDLEVQGVYNYSYATTAFMCTEYMNTDILQRLQNHDLMQEECLPFLMAEK